MKQIFFLKVWLGNTRVISEYKNSSSSFRGELFTQCTGVLNAVFTLEVVGHIEFGVDTQVLLMPIAASIGRGTARWCFPRVPQRLYTSWVAVVGLGGVSKIACCLLISVGGEINLFILFDMILRAQHYGLIKKLFIAFTGLHTLRICCFLYNNRDRTSDFCHENTKKIPPDM